MRVIAALFLAACMACPVEAAFKGPTTGFTAVHTVSEAANSSENTTCVLEGSVIEHLARDRYTFKDGTGSITVNIPPHVFGNLDVTPETVVKLTGEIGGKKDGKRLDPHVRVRYLEILQ